MPVVFLAGPMNLLTSQPLGERARLAGRFAAHRVPLAVQPGLPGDGQPDGGPQAMAQIASEHFRSLE